MAGIRNLERPMGNMFGPTSRKVVSSLAALPLLLLAGCGGGDDPALSPQVHQELLSDPDVTRLTGILEDADTFVTLGWHLTFTFEDGVLPPAVLLGAADCSGTECVSSSNPSERVVLSDVIGQAMAEDHYLGGLTLGERGGFDTFESSGGFVMGSYVAEMLEGIESSPPLDGRSTTEHGLWGMYGYAGTALGHSDRSYTIPDVDSLADIDFYFTYVAGTVSGSNPAGTGRATWSGIAEAIVTATNEPAAGTATVTIEDLSMPRASVDVEIGGAPIGSWTDMTVTDGEYGVVGGGNGVKGAFYGPSHEESYGVFYTDLYGGVFGAMRQ